MALLSPLGAYPYTVTQGYGGPGGHPGIDLAAPTGTPVIAPAAGTVTVPGFDAGGFGNWIIEKVQGLGDLIFGHLSAIDVTSGEQVTAGEQIGNVGSTGDSTGPHLHYELGGAGTGTPLQDPTGLLPGPGNGAVASGIQPANPGQASILSAVDNATADYHTRLALLVGSYLESDLNPTAPTGGAFQLISSRATPAQADNPTTAVGLVLSDYQAAVAGGTLHGYTGPTAALWSSNPEQAAVEAAQAAEGPGAPYLTTQGQGRIDQAYQTAVGLLAGQGSTQAQATLADIHIPGTPWSIPTPGDIAGGIAGDVEKGILGVIETVTSPLKNFLEDVGLIVLGLIIGVIGLVVLAHASSSGSSPTIVQGGSDSEEGEEAGEEGAEAAAL